MSNKERLQRNNSELLNIQTMVDNLPEAGSSSGGGSSVELNVFMQETEPITYDGIWLQGNNTVDSIIADGSIVLEPEWNLAKMGETPAITREFYNGAAVVVGTDIYIIGGENDTDSIIKYDTLTNTYSGKIPYPDYSHYGSAVAIGTKVYIFGDDTSESGSTMNYDTLTGEFTWNTSVPYHFYQGAVVAIGTDIYLIGGYKSQYNFYRYDTLTKTYFQLSNLPYSFYCGSAVVVGTDIYLFGGAYNDYKAYKYNTLTATFSSLARCPFAFYSGSAVAVGTDIYLFGSGDSQYGKYCYKYDTLTNRYTSFVKIPYEFRRGSAVLVGSDVYLLGGETNKTKVQVLSFPSKTYTPNTVVIEQTGGQHKTKLLDAGIDNLTVGFDRVFYSDSTSALTSLPTYVGNGTEWVQI